MSEPGFQPSAVAAAQQERLWDKAPGWRNLTVLASFLTLAAVATPLLLPQPVTHQTMTQALSRPAAPVEQQAVPQALNTASLPPQSEPAAGPGVPTQPAAGAPHTGAPAVDLASLPAGTEIVPSGVLTRVNRHNRYAPQLGGDLPLTITLISPPAHGTVTTTRGTALMSFPNAGVTRVSSVTNVFYQSAPGYVGDDSFTYKRTSPDPNDPMNARTYTVTIYAK
jgi:hypothetical protein